MASNWPPPAWLFVRPADPGGGRRSVEVARPAPPLDTPVTVAELKAHCGAVEGAAEDGVALAVLQGATAYVEELARCPTVPVTVTERRDRFPVGRGPLDLAVEPARAVVAVRYVAPDGADRTLPTSAYRAWLAAVPPLLYPAPGTDWPAAHPDEPGAVTVTYEAGPAAPAACRPQLRLAVLAIATLNFEHRDLFARTGELSVPPAATGLITLGSRRGYP